MPGFLYCVLLWLTILCILCVLSVRFSLSFVYPSLLSYSSLPSCLSLLLCPCRPRSFSIVLCLVPLKRPASVL
ncbi:hypothetical protein CPB84DRAFT_1779239 [Gymnopilus junonius]|uniref:Uncharacterized protein n=1 Tax=Gymnopilus junonius TaxID=109634 RepID=A0A9P5NP57_GYMJU|nr:hypothetical protein CPB84DRAFT_1779239 [Gymnopilus junonius]